MILCLFHFRSKQKRMQISVFAFTLMLLSPGNKSRNLFWVLILSISFISKMEVQRKRNRIYL